MSAFELHYSDGGHGGPYATMFRAVRAAVRIARGQRSDYYRVTVRYGVNGPAYAAVVRDPGGITIDRYATFANRAVRMGRATDGMCWDGRYPTRKASSCNVYSGNSVSDGRGIGYRR